MSNINDLTKRSVIFEKTPKWRQLYERTGSLIDVLKSYLKEIRPSVQLHELIYEKAVVSDRKADLFKRSKTMSFSALDLNRNKFPKSASCLDAYGLDESFFDECKHGSFGDYEGKRNSSFLQAIQMKRTRSYSASLCDETSEAKRRLSGKDQFDLSADFSNCSFSSVFEETTSSQYKSCDSSSPFNTEANSDQTESQASAEQDSDTDVVYLNDIYGDILSSQESKTANEKLSDRKEKAPSPICLAVVQHDITPQPNHFNGPLQTLMSIPPPPIIPMQYFMYANMYGNTYAPHLAAYYPYHFWPQQSAYQQPKK